MKRNLVRIAEFKREKLRAIGRWPCFLLV